LAISAISSNPHRHFFALVANKAIAPIHPWASLARRLGGPWATLGPPKGHPNPIPNRQRVATTFQMCCVAPFFTPDLMCSQSQINDLRENSRHPYRCPLCRPIFTQGHPMSFKAERIGRGSQMQEAARRNNRRASNCHRSLPMAKGQSPERS
jgi:hypothetical protein